MNRRRFLRAVATGSIALTAGCTASSVSDRFSANDSPPTVSRRGDSLAEHGYPATICETDVIEEFAISAITDPAFASDWQSHDISEEYHVDRGPGLSDDAVVVGLARGSGPRAYPVSVLWSHEIVNDTLDVPVLVTYCSICRSGMVAERRVHGRPTTFGVSGQLWRPPDLQARVAVEENRTFGAVRSRPERASNATEVSSPTEVRVRGNLVMYDELTGSFWSQLLAEAICGPQAGHSLTVLPAERTTWGEWRQDHPETVVLLPPPHSTEM